MFNENKQKNISSVNVFILFLFVFSRTLILIPENHFGLNINNLQLDLSVESVSFVVLLIICSVLFSYVANVIYNKSRETMLPLVFLVLFDCVFYALLDDCLKLIVVILGLLCVLNELSNKQLIKDAISFPLYIFISMLLEPKFIFSFIALAFIIYLVCNADNHSNQKRKTLIISLICVFVGATVNLLLTKNFDVVAVFLKDLSFADVIPTEKNWKTFISFVPMIIVGFVLYDKLLKANKKTPSKKRREFVTLSADLVGVGYFFALAGFIFFQSEAFITINLIIPISLITCSLKGESVVVNEILIAIEKINKHKILAFFIAVIVFYWCFDAMYDYNIGVKIIDYIRY